MKTSDINKFKGQMKGALQKWANGKIDEILPTKPAMRAVLKKGLDNALVRYDDKINKWVDTLFLFTGNEKGVIDTDVMVDNMANIFKEMEPHIYQFGICDVEVGKGEVAFHLPDHYLCDILIGGSGTFRMTIEDILDLKQYFN